MGLSNAVIHFEASDFRLAPLPGLKWFSNLKETTGAEFRVYRASTRLLKGIYTFYKAPITVTTHLKMS